MLSLLIVAVYTYNKTSTALLDRTFNQLTSVKVVKKRQLETFFHDRIKDVELFAQSEDIQKVIYFISLKSNKDSIVQNKEIKSLFIFNYIYSCSYYSEIQIITPKGSLIENKKNKFKTIQNIGGFDKNQSKILFDELIINITSPQILDYTKVENEYFLKVVSPIRKDDSTVAFVVFTIPLESINNIMLENKSKTGFGESGESYLVGKDSLMRSGSRFQSNSVMKVAVNTEASQLAFKQIDSTCISHDYRGIKVLSSFTLLDIEGLEWFIFAEIDYEEAMIPIKNTRNEILFICMLISISIFLLAYFIARKITKPIINLKNATEQISNGIFIQVKEFKASDEISDLTLSFNTMSNLLKEKQEQLENERKLRLTAIIDGQEIERQRFSRELHDGLGQSLVALKFKLESCDKSLTYEERNIFIEDIVKQLNHILEEVRLLSYNLMPAALNEFGLKTALTNLAKQLSENSKISINFDAVKSIQIEDKRINIYLYRIVQEALNNALKYAYATQIDVQLLENKVFFVMIIEDNGIGFDYKDLTMGNGLYNMKERVQLLNGIFEIESSKGKGTTIYVKIPKNKDGEN